MLRTKLKIAAWFVLAAAAVGPGFGLIAQRASGQPPASAPQAAAGLPVTGDAPTSAPRPFRVPTLQGLNYGGPNTLSGQWVGTEWLRSGTGTGDRWEKVRPALERDLAFIEAHPNLGRAHRVFVGLDQLMVWDKTTGFVRFHEACLDNFETALKMFDAHGLKIFVVLYDQEVQGSLGNFRYQALDGQHPEIRRNYLRATEIFLRRFGTSPTVIGWDLFNEAYNSLGAEGGLPRPPHENPVSPNYPTATVHEWIKDLYKAAKGAAPDAWFTVSDTTDIYWRERPNLDKYAGAVDFYDLHVYDKNPKVRNWRELLGKPVILGEVGSPEGGYDDLWLNAAVTNYFLEHAGESGASAILFHAPSHNWGRWVAEGPAPPGAVGFLLKPRPAGKAPQAQPGGATSGSDIDWQRAQRLYDRSQRGEKLTDEEQTYLDRAKQEYHKPGNPGGPPAVPSAR